MSKRISKKTRELIRMRFAEVDEHGRRVWSVRTLAKELGCTPNTIQRWKSCEDTSDRPRNTKGRPGLSDFGKVAFREMVRLTGYPHSRLFEYLKPVWGELPAQGRMEADREGDWRVDPLTADSKVKRRAAKALHPITFLREMKKHSLHKFTITPPSEPAELAAHIIQVTWQYENGTTDKGDLLIFLERYSGLAYARIFSGMIDTESFRKTLKRFEHMLGSVARKVNLVTSSYWKKLDLSKFDIQIAEDPHTKKQTEPIFLPGKHMNKHDLNQCVKRILDLINLTDGLKRTYRTRKRPIDLAPYKMYLCLIPSRFKDAGSEKRLKKRLQLIKK